MTVLKEIDQKFMIRASFQKNLKKIDYFYNWCRIIWEEYKIGSLLTQHQDKFLMR